MEAVGITTKNLAVLTKAGHPQMELVFKKNVTAEQIHQSLDRIFKELGCPGCGLGGLDLRLIPEEVFRPIQQMAEFKQLAGIKQVTVTHF